MILYCSIISLLEPGLSTLFPPFQCRVIVHRLLSEAASKFQRWSKQRNICVKAISRHLNHKLLGFILVIIMIRYFVFFLLRFFNWLQVKRDTNWRKENSSCQHYNWKDILNLNLLFHGKKMLLQSFLMELVQIHPRPKQSQLYFVFLSLILFVEFVPQSYTSSIVSQVFFEKEWFPCYHSTIYGKLNKYTIFVGVLFILSIGFYGLT